MEFRGRGAYKKNWNGHANCKRGIAFYSKGLTATLFLWQRNKIFYTKCKVKTKDGSIITNGKKVFSLKPYVQIYNYRPGAY